MGFKSKYHIDVDFEVPKKLNWYYAPLYAVFWLILYLSIVVTSVSHLPTPLNIKDETDNTESFIAERAERILINLGRIGPRVVGSVANEITTVEFLKQEIEKVRAQASDYFEFEVDVQIASGNYMHWSMINMYQSIQNVIVKLSMKGSTNENYLLMNSHYDSVPGSNGAGDDGSMVTVMLEVMRVISKGQGPLKHPIVFLFNGAEENPLQASHAFITQHKWAKNCKALINLDAAGSGGREVLFQSGPKHPWLMRYYREVPHPFATTMGEEIFQAGLIPSDTDFRIFRDYGGVPGLDMAYTFNGFVYHTEHDRVNTFPKGSLQNTGDNVLVLAKAIANAPEMENTLEHEDGHVIFYDFLGWFMVFYNKTVGIVINIIVCIAGLCAIGVSLFFMSARSGLTWKAVLIRFGITFSIQIISLALGTGLSLLVAVFMDGVGCSMTWFTENWILAGLYFCPMFFGMGILPAIYLDRTKTDPLSLGFRIQLFMHCHCLVMILLTIILTAVGIRSSFMFMIAVFFDIIALIVNLLTKWHRKAYWFAIAAIICQILPFIYFTSITQEVFNTMLPMMGRSGSGSNPDLTMALIAVFTTIMFAGFIIPLFLFFRKTKTIIMCFLGITILFIIIAVTPAGFPYKAITSAQRFNLIHVHRRLHNADNTIRTDEAGIYIYPQDRRTNTAEDHIKELGNKRQLSELCSEEMFCGIPLFNHRWHKARDRSFWVPTDEYPILPEEYPELILQNTVTLEQPTQRRYQFALNGPDHMAIFIEPQENTKIVNWTFNQTMLEEKWEPPFFIYFSYGISNATLEFSIDIEKSDLSFDSPSLEIGIGGHWIHHQKTRSESLEKFVQSAPDYWTITDWVASYESWLF
ncbi:endoplasmic reticulum metallopeptidase 1 [Teleopsis dalmanni]|uniref:endoplasmic reticulum metallopeptidase 1 n=1 Tax=Teleopsis dalmanni TaxID=139649 RepID=UPI0018CDA774|nr:endoplasmic reticulum metallopeptidase 1 [Teleopsis dalmanni]